MVQPFVNPEAGWEQGLPDLSKGIALWYSYRDPGQYALVVRIAPEGAVTFMGATLNTAAGLGAYTLADRATWLSFKNRADLVLQTQGDKRLFNQYATILVNPGRHKHVKEAAARTFMDYLVSAEGQEAIGAFQIGGETLFFPNAGGQQ